MYHKIENNNVFNCIHDQRQDCNDGQLQNCSLPLESKLDLVWNVSIRSQVLGGLGRVQQGPGQAAQHHQHSRLRQRSIARVLSKVSMASCCLSSDSGNLRRKQPGQCLDQSSNPRMCSLSIKMQWRVATSEEQVGASRASRA